MAESRKSYLARPEFAFPASELAHAARLVHATRDHYSPEAVRRSYADLDLAIYADPFASDVADRVAAALTARRPLSVVRIGDGEANILSWGADPATPALDRYGVARLVARQADAFAPDDAWMLALRELMLAAVLEADIVGVIGLWRPKESRLREISLDQIRDFLASDPRGLIGHWRAVDHMLRLARRGLLRHKILASAHLYFGILRHLPVILAETERVLLISGRARAMDALARRYPGQRFDRIMVGGGASRDALPLSPGFLTATEEALPRDLTGRLCLVGAGPWAEIYCGWIRRRGGVAVDIGSGFDLMENRITRPVHRNVGLEAANEFAL